jgi:hypothetical protein
MKSRCWLLGVCLWGGVVSAQEAQPSVVPFPLELKSAGTVTDKDQAELQSTWRRLLRVGALVPDTGSVDAALAATGRRDCEREDECLKALAVKAGTLYAVYASVGLDLTRTKAVATGRVVRDDGKRLGELRTTTVDVGADGFLPAAKTALTKLVEFLEVAKLSPVRPVDEPVATNVRPDGVGGVPPTPPPAVTAERPMSGGKLGGIVLMVGGGAVLVTGVGLLASAAADTEALKIDGEGRVTGLPMTPETADKAKSLGARRGLGGVFTGIGAAAAVAGVVVFLVSGNQSGVAVGATPLPGGFAASVGGTW